MADPFGIATEAVSIIGFGGQVAQGVSFLYCIFKDVKDFSESLRDFVSNLELLRNIPEWLEANKLPPSNGEEDVMMKAYRGEGEIARKGLDKSFTPRPLKSRTQINTYSQRRV